MEKNDTQISMRSLLVLTGIAGLFAGVLVLFDIIYGSIISGNPEDFPKTAEDFINLFDKGLFSGLYHLDFVNMISYIVSLPFYFGLAMLVKKQGKSLAILAAILFFCGTAVFLAANAALPMAELADKFFQLSSDQDKLPLLAAAEALLIKGRHGGLGIFPAMLLLSTSGILLSFSMLKSDFINKKLAMTGIIGNPLLLLYIILAAFSSNTENIAMLIAAPGGLLNLVWMTGIVIKLLKMSRKLQGNNLPDAQKI